MSHPAPGIPIMPEDHNPAWERPAPGAGVYVPPETPAPDREERDRVRSGRARRILEFIERWVWW